MKITLATRFFWPQGGAERFLINFARYLVGQGHQVRVYAFRGDPQPGVELVLLKTPPFLPRAARDWETARLIARRLQTDDADVRVGGQKFWGCEVLIPLGGVEEEFWKSHVQFRTAIPFPPVCRYFHIKRYFDLDAEARGYRDPRLRWVVVESDLVRRQLLHYYPHLADKIRIVFQGTPIPVTLADQRDLHRPKLLPSFGLDPKRLVALFMGHDFSRKGLRYALEALAAVRRRNPASPWQLLVVGRDNAKPYKALARQLGITDAVAFVGSVPDPSACYAASDLLLFPTTFDSFAIVTIEAMSAGIPVLTTAQNGGCEIIDEGINGWVIADPGMTERMADHLIALEDPQKRLEMRTAVIATARRHSAENKFRETEALLASAARRPA
jgi:UDP-glucose:(heptosyl)LPS alpha-1,3-glucosyltransferase